MLVAALGPWATAATAQPVIDSEAARESSWELGASASALRLDDAFATGVEARWSAAFGARLAWRPEPRVALGFEAWRAEPGDLGSVTAAGAHLRVAPWSDRWPLSPALHVGIEGLFSDDEEERSVAFVAGAGLVHLARRWTLDLAVRNHHLSIAEDPVPRDGELVETARDSSLWEVRAALAVVLGAGG